MKNELRMKNLENWRRNKKWIFLEQSRRRTRQMKKSEQIRKRWKVSSTKEYFFNYKVCIEKNV
jgi:hypothetical protein